MFTLALNSAGELVSVENAESGIDYVCCHCKAHMRLRRYVQNTRHAHFFVHRDTHKSTHCNSVEKEKHIVRDPSLLNCEKLKYLIMSAPSTNPGGPGKGRHHPGGNHEMAVRAPNSLMQIKVCGLCEESPSMPIDGGVLSDILLTPKSYSNFLMDNNGLGFRILVLRPVTARNNHVRFVAFWKNNWGRHRSFFELDVDDPIICNELCKTLFHCHRNKGNVSIWEKTKYQEVLVAGIWYSVEDTICKAWCNYCKDAKVPCHGMRKSSFSNMNQIYISDLPENTVPFE